MLYNARHKISIVQSLHHLIALTVISRQHLVTTQRSNSLYVMVGRKIKLITCCNIAIFREMPVLKKGVNYSLSRNSGPYCWTSIRQRCQSRCN